MIGAAKRFAFSDEASVISATFCICVDKRQSECLPLSSRVPACHGSVRKSPTEETAMHFELSRNRVRTSSWHIPSESTDQKWRMGLLLLGTIILLLWSPIHLQAQSGMTSKNGAQMTCASDDMRRHYCPVNTSRGVRLVNQR